MGVESDVVRDVEGAHNPVQPAAGVVAEAHFQRGLAQVLVRVEARGRIGRAVAIALDRAGRALDVADHGQVQVVGKLMLQHRRHAVDVDALGRIFGRIELVGIVVLARVGDVAVQRRRDAVVLARIAPVATAEQLQRHSGLGAEVQSHGGATGEQVLVAEAFTTARIDDGRNLGLDNAADHRTIAGQIARARARHETTALLRQHGQTHADLVAQRTADGRLHGQVVMAADLDAPGAFDHVARPLGDGVDDARRGVAPVQGALRPLQDLDPVQVEQGHAQIGVRGLIDAVHMQGDRGIAVGLVVVRAADAANADQAVVGAAKGVVHRHARNLVDQIGHAADPATRRVVAVQHRDRQRHVLDALGALLGRDDHVLDRSDAFGSEVGMGDCNRKGASADRRHRQPRALDHPTQGLGGGQDADDAVGAAAAHGLRREQDLHVGGARQAGQRLLHRLALDGEGNGRAAARRLGQSRRGCGHRGDGRAGEKHALEGDGARLGNEHGSP
ncbi:hypothetical protein D3C72_579970 [compost metagenome]